MPIEYNLRENRLTAEPGDYMATVKSTRTAGYEEVIDRVVGQGTTVGKADAISVIENTLVAVTGLLVEGANVNLPFANFSCSIKGTFNGPEDTFDPSRHQIVINITTTKELRDAVLQSVTVSKQETVVPTPNLVEYMDFNTGERNSIVTPSGMAQISGNRLQFDSTDPEQGIFFIATSNGSETRVGVVGKNMPSTLMFLLPAELTTGEYALEVRAKMGDALRTGSLNSVLSVA
jgi:hypothetical protein